MLMITIILICNPEEEVLCTSGGNFTFYVFRLNTEVELETGGCDGY